MTPTRTSFAGLEQLAPGDPLSSDGYAFQFENPSISDALMKLGAVTHRHDGHAAMVSPTTDPTIVASGTGGTVPGNTTISVGYTLIDGQGGESALSPIASDTTPGGYADPDMPPDGVADYTGGALLANTWTYGVTVADGLGGETAISPSVDVVIDAGHANAQALISNLSALVSAVTSDPAASWRLWRMVGGSPWYLIGTGIGTLDTFDDTGIAGDCSVQPPTTNSTGGTGSFTATVPAAGQPPEATSFNLYACSDGTFTSPCLIGNYPTSAFGAAQVFSSLGLLNGQPPATSQCKPGANRLNPDTDFIGGSWKVLPSSQQAADYVLQLSDLGTVIEFTGGAAEQLTVPPNSSVAMPVGALVKVCQYGAGQVNVVGGAGVTVRAPGGLTHTSAQYATIGLRQRAADEWVLEGSLG